MTDQSAGHHDARSGLLRRILLAVVGLILTPVAIALNPHAFASAARAFRYNGLALPEHRHRVSYRSVTETAAEERRDEARDLIMELAEDEDWISLAELAQEWDEGRVHAGRDHPLAMDALDAATSMLADGFYEANYCTPIDIPAIPEHAFAVIGPLRERHPDLPFLAILEANLHLMKAWENRGTRASIHVSEAGWIDATKRIEKSRWAVAPLIDAGYNSPLLARLQIGWLAFGCDGLADFRRPFDTYRAADPGSSYGNAWMGYYLLERWYGEGDYDAELRAECDRLGARGPEAYVHGYLDVMDLGDGLLPGIDGDYFAQVVIQLGHRYSDDQYRLNRFLARVLQIGVHQDVPSIGREAKAAWAEMFNKIQMACAEVLRRHVTAIHPEAFPDDSPMLDLMADAMPEAFAAGDDFILDENGLRTVPPDPV